MQAVEQHPYVEQVLCQLAGEHGIGEALGEDATLEFLENEIMKIGSLAHTGIEWSRVESESLRLLSDRSKDLKVLGFMLLCLQRGGNGERFALSLYLLQRVLASWWSEAWPYPGETGKRARRMLFVQMMQRAAGEAGTLSFDGAVGDGRHYCLALLDRLVEQVKQLDIPDEGLTSLRRSVEKRPEAGQSRPPEAGNAVLQETATTSSSNAASVGSTAPALGNVSFDPGNERATRQSLLKVADLLCEVTPSDPLGYQIRRYAIWNAISATPPARDGKRTDLAAVSADRVADYREALGRGADPALWQRIEQSLSVSPFWLEGHGLSAEVASSLGHEACAEAIRAALKAFIERLPALAGMTFNDGTPFLPKAVDEWLMAASVKSREGGPGQRWEQAYQQARELLDGPGLAAGMQLLEDGLANAREPRERFYWQLMSVDLLRDSGLKALAKQHVSDLREQTRGMTLSDWEPALVARLERLA